MLTAGEIAVRIGRGEIAWSGELRGDGLLLRLGTPLQPLTRGNGDQVVDLAEQDSIEGLYAQPAHGWSDFELLPGRMVLCSVEHPLRLGARLAAAIGTLSHLARVGLATHVTSPWVMPGWDGHLTLELLNCGPVTLKLRRGIPVARAVIFAMDGITQEAIPHPHYGHAGHLGSRYAIEFGDELGPSDLGAGVDWSAD
jgi:deoxycytidine triphosphate deaminase